MTPMSSSHCLKPPPTIIVVDDEPAFRDIYRSVIEGAFNVAKILVFRDGDSAWHQIECEMPDLIISDILRPGMTGVEMLWRLANKNASCPIMMVSGALPEKEEWARHCAGAQLNVRYIPKPFCITHLISILEKLLNQVCSDECLVRDIASLDRPLKIVQLDDEEFVFEFVTQVVQRSFKEVQLLQFQNSQFAWKILTETNPDLLITDDIMNADPQWNGENIVRGLIKSGVAMPIIVSSGWPQTQLWVSNVRAEYCQISFLPKPFTLSQLYRELSRFFRPLHPNSGFELP